MGLCIWRPYKLTLVGNHWRSLKPSSFDVGCVHYCCCSYYAAASYSWKSGLAMVDLDWRHLIAKPLTRTSVRWKDLGDICCTSWGIAHFVLNFVAMATRVSRDKFQLAAFDVPFPKTPLYMQKMLQISLTQAELEPILSQILLTWQWGLVGGKCDWRHSMAHPHKLSYRCKNLAEISYASWVKANFVPNFIAMPTVVGRGKCDWRHSMAHSRKPHIVAKISQKFLTQAEL